MKATWTVTAPTPVAASWGVDLDEPLTVSWVVEATTTVWHLLGAIPGPPGPPGGGTYTHVQDAPSQSWVVTHGLGRWPSIAVGDSAGDVVLGDAKYLSDNEVRLDFGAPFSGRAYLN